MVLEKVLENLKTPLEFLENSKILGKLYGHII